MTMNIKKQMMKMKGSDDEGSRHGAGMDAYDKRGGGQHTRPSWIRVWLARMPWRMGESESPSEDVLLCPGDVPWVSRA